ncbi:long-chain fatty acid transport protein 2-like [Liolophura sinensis]|uniref:long-chain fatty acid transport protein 2-like n=1 Tax=Liolophura sinensis TaxID=3198878 RepID=UPI0031585462
MANKVIYGAMGALGTSYAAYKALCPWLALDVMDLALRDNVTRLFQEAVASKTYLIDAFEQSVKNTPDKYFLIYNDMIFTYQDVDRKANKMARVIRTWGLNKDDVIAMFMHNEPEFVWTFIGILKLGIPVCMVNYNLRHQSLVHSLRTCEAKAVICSSDGETMRAVSELGPELDGLAVYVHDLPGSEVTPPCRPLSGMLARVSGDKVEKAWREPVEPLDPMCYVFTSGTTGNPKPALLTQIRGQSLMQVLQSNAGMTEEDILYTCLPMYHSAALFLGLMGVMNTGSTMVLSRKFSATRFWEDCRKHKVTGIQYIGELCRYLLTKAMHPRDGQHCIRFAYGNGLRADIWEEFQRRFKIPKIVEFFGATESSGSLVNIHNKPGAVGRYSPYMAWRDNNSKVLVKYDISTAQPIRDERGLCIQVKLGEPGLLLIRFPPHIQPDKIYLKSEEKVKEKIARNVLQKGDVFFNFGDLLYMDKNYFLYFVDRIGDTFRWKGENVSTLEVANTLTRLDFILDANVYGVKVPGNDGRAGMACLLLEGSRRELTESMCMAIYQLCEEDLPRYARPLFLRVQGEMKLTVTWKQQKVQLIEQGFDLTQTQDAMYHLDDVSKSYSRLTDESYLKYVSGKSKL